MNTRWLVSLGILTLAFTLSGASFAQDEAGTDSKKPLEEVLVNRHTALPCEQEEVERVNTGCVHVTAGHIEITADTLAAPCTIVHSTFC